MKRALVLSLNTLRPRQNGRHSADDILKCIFLSENLRIAIHISLKFVPRCPFNNNPALVRIMAWRQSGDKPLSEPMVVSLLMHICVTRPQWLNCSPVLCPVGAEWAPVGGAWGHETVYPGEEWRVRETTEYAGGETTGTGDTAHQD